METLLQLHSYWAYIALALLIASFLNSLFSLWSKNNYYVKDLRLALFTLIVYYIQLLLGLAWYFMSPSYKHLKEIGMSEAMKDSTTRFLSVEHPLVMLLTILLISVGFSFHRKKEKPSKKFKTIVIYYGIALLLILIRIPWKQWFD